jgi:hypothetical protein
MGYPVMFSLKRLAPSALVGESPDVFSVETFSLVLGDIGH